MNVEDKVSGTGLIQTLSREGIPVKGIKRNIDKVTRGLDAAPMVETGNVFLPIDAPWLSDFLGEASAFPNGKHDDQLDPMFDAVTDVKAGSSWVGAI
jgi:predicted phage terminase large subunit-like protein